MTTEAPPVIEHRPPYLAAALAAGAVLLIYLATLAPTTGMWDASEYIATAHILGIPHPPGNPLFVVLGRVWTLLLAPTGLPVAVRMNVFAAVTSAGAVFFFFLVSHRVLFELVEEEWARIAGASAAALLGGTAYTVWSQSTVNEKVYTLSVLVIAAVSWLAVRWMDRRREPGSERLLLVAGYLLVLGSTSHLMSVLPLPSLGVFVLLVSPGVLLRKGLWLRALPLALLGVSFNFFLPVRAAQEPVINEGHPTCESVGGAAAAVLTNGAAGCEALAANLQRRQYQKPPVTLRMAPFRDQLANWLQYFDWQWARGADPAEQPGNARLPFTLLFLGLGLAGLWAAWRADREIFAYLVGLVVTLTVALVFYLNFRYGYSLNPEVTDLNLHEVRERDYFFVAGFMLWGVLAGTGLAWVWSRAARVVRSPSRYLVTAPLLLVAFIPLWFNRAWASRAGDYAPRDWAYDLLVSVEPYAVLFTNGDNDTFPLWYLQEVEGLREDVTVVVAQYLYTDWYPRQIQALSAPDRQRPFEPEDASGLYEPPPAPPATSISELDPAQLDRVGGGTLPQDLTVRFPTLAVTFPQGMGLDRAERLALSFIHDTIDERPIYFSGRGGLMNDLGLARWGVQHGLVVKLDLRPDDAERPSYVRIAPSLGGDVFDYDRTVELYRDVYSFRGFKNREVWADRSTLSIPWNYYALALRLQDAARQRGADPEFVRRLGEDAAAFQTTATGGSIGTP